jgi:hypothetical protein
MKIASKYKVLLCITITLLMVISGLIYKTLYFLPPQNTLKCLEIYVSNEASPLLLCEEDELYKEIIEWQQKKDCVILLLHYFY